jgi:hypothetical protein
MFVGHYAASFYIKSREPSIPLWVLFLAVQLVDIAWALLVLAGIEQLAMVPGITRASPLDLVYVPYTHSLVAVLGWSLLVCWLWYRIGNTGASRAKAALLVGLAVLSHWIGDLLVHRPDLPLYDNSAKVGMGLWNYPMVSFSIEIGLLALAMGLWYRRSSGRAGRFTLFQLWFAMAIVQAYQNFLPITASPNQFVVLALIMYLLFAFMSRASDVPSPAPAS